MKKILFFILTIFPVILFAQSKGYLRYDSVYIQKIGGNATLIIENATRGVTGGVLTNTGNGRTAFVTPSGGPSNSIGSAGFKTNVDGTNNFKKLFISNGLTGDSLTSGQVGIKLGSALTGATRIPAQNFSFILDSMGNGTRFIQRTSSAPAFNFDITSTNGVDSAYFKLTENIFSTNRAATMGLTSPSGRFGKLEVSMINSASPVILLQNAHPTNQIDVNIRVDSMFAGLYANDPDGNSSKNYTFADSIILASYATGSTSPHSYLKINRTSLYGQSDSAIVFSSKSADQYAEDSVVWRLTNRDASLTFNSGGWHAHQKDGEYYFYNVALVTDSTGLDLLAWDRADEEMVRIPSNLVGGGSGVTTMGAIGSSPNANGATITGTTLNLQPANGSFGGAISTTTQTMGAGDKTFTNNVNVGGRITSTLQGEFSYLRLTETGAFSSPVSGFGYIWTKNDGTLHFRNDADVDFDLTAGGSTPLFPLTGTGTATGNVTGALGTNSIVVSSNGTGRLFIDGGQTILYNPAQEGGLTLTPQHTVLYSRNSSFWLQNDSISAHPYRGNYFIDSLDHSLTATGKMMVWDSINNRISTRAIPSGGGGTIGGSIAANQVAVGSGSNTIAGSSNFTYDGTTSNWKSDINFTGSGGGTDNNTLNWGAKYDRAALILYDGGAGSRGGWGLRASNMQFFIANNWKFTLNKGGDFQAAGTNEMFVVDPTNNKILLNMDVGIGATTPSAQLHTTGTVRFANFGAGNAVFDAAGNLSSSSDERLKYIQGFVGWGLKDVKKINTYRYKWRPVSGMETEHTYAGFSAQNIQSVLGSEATGINKDGYLSVQDRAVMAAMINAIKELSAKVDYLEAELKKKR